ncbi:MAG: LysM peptidoglycan-binding domain-containing protein, partial [Nitrospirales bacterium]
MGVWITHILAASLLFTGCAHGPAVSSPGEDLSVRRQAEKAIRDAQAEVARMREELAQTRIESAKKEVVFRELQQYVSRLRQELDLKETELARLRSERDQLLRAKAELEARVAALPGLRQVAGEAQAHVELAEKKGQVRLRDLEAAVKGLAHELDQLKKHLGQSRPASLKRSSRSTRSMNPQQALTETVLSRIEEPGVWVRVQPGDSLWKLSRDYGVSVDDLRASNGLH